MSFVHLHSHTGYSLLDGAGKINKMIAETKKLGMDALAITDHGNMYGVLEFYTQAEKAGIKPIIGCEAYVAPKSRKTHAPVQGESHSYHLVLLAKNETGFKNLIKLTSYSYLEGFYYKPRIDRELLHQYSEGLIALSACMKGEIAFNLRRERKQKAIEVAEDLLDIFGDDFYFELQDHGIPEENATYPLVHELAREMNVPVVATNDVHYLHKKDSQAHDILLCLQTGKDRDDPNRMRYNTQELYLKSPEEMYQIFKKNPEVVERTLEVASKIDLKLDFNKRYMPEFPIPESEGKMSADEYLEVLSRRGLQKKYSNIKPDIEKRLQHELSVIKNMGFAGYFLIVQDFINAAREKDIPVGLGRGSAAGSIVAYTLGITDVDPIRYDLLFERFLNPSRITMPDIDIDFCYERRDEVIDYVRHKYGKKNVAQIITFGTMASKGVIRDVSRVLKVPISTADAIAKKIPIHQGKPMPLEKAFEKIPELKTLAENDDPQMKELVEYSKALEGLSRHSSVHAAGIIIAPDDITNYAPLCISSDKQVTTQWTMGWAEKIGLLKMDFLGLRNLTVIHNTEKLIRERYQADFKIENIPMDDAATFNLFGEGRTIGVFQFESSGMQEYLRKLKPNRIEDLIAMNALYRPGPMEMIDDFIERKKGNREIVYIHDKLKPILEETYGIIVYQEQVMRISSDLAGFSMAEADSMRRVMSKKQKEKMQVEKDKFVNGCINNGIDKKIAAQIAELIEKFASYGFNKSHSAAYAIIAYQTGYLKSNYPAEFMAANLTSEVSNSDKIIVLMDECRRMGLEIVAPDVNHSEAKFVPLGKNKIAFGMAAIKNVGLGAISSIIEGREKAGSYNSIFHLMQNVDMRQVNKKVLESLAQCGALDSLEGNRAQLFHSIEKAIEFGQYFHEGQKRNQGQHSLFDGAVAEEETVVYPDLPDISDWSEHDKLKLEREFLGFYISGHPLQKYRTLVELFRSKFEVARENGGKAAFADSFVNICGMITDMRTLLDKKQNRMAFVKIEDFNQSYEAVIFGSVFPEVEPTLNPDKPVLLRGRLNSDLDDPVIKIVCEKAYELEQVPAVLAESLNMKIDKSALSEENIKYMKNLLNSHRGNQPVYFYVAANGNKPVKMVSQKIKINISAALLYELEKILGLENLSINMIKT